VAGERPEAALVILDLMLPGAHGFDVLKALRASSEVPVLVLSARVDTHDKVRALALGADDYMTKPFWPEELKSARCGSIPRPARSRSTAGPSS
jgi:two-component system response regulator MtrA